MRIIVEYKVSLMECSNKHQFVVDTILNKNVIKIPVTDHYNNTYFNLKIVCPECGEDNSKIENLDIYC